MNTDTGHLINDNLYKELLREEMQEREKLKEKFINKKNLQNYEPVPKELQTAAKMKLGGKDEAMVSLTSGGKLSRWASKKRKEKRKMAKQSRKQNR